MTISERKKALSSVATTERYLKTRWDKMQTEEDVINQPLNEDVNVCDPEMRQYFPRIFVRSPENTLSRTLVTLFRFHLLNLISIYWLIVQLRIQLINIIIQIYYFFVVLLRTAIEFLFDYAFYVIFADHFFNWMPEQYLWLVLTIVFILTKLFTVRSVYPVMAEFRVLLIVQNRRLSSCWQWWPFPLLQSWWVTPLSPALTDRLYNYRLDYSSSGASAWAIYTRHSKAGQSTSPTSTKSARLSKCSAPIAARAAASSTSRARASTTCATRLARTKRTFLSVFKYLFYFLSLPSFMPIKNNRLKPFLPWF